MFTFKGLHEGLAFDAGTVLKTLLGMHTSHVGMPHFAPSVSSLLRKLSDRQYVTD